MAHHVPAAGGAGFLGGRRFDDHFRLHHPFRPGERPPERAPWHRAGHRHQRCHHGSGAARVFLLHAFWQLCLWAIPYGLGAGSVDAALNNYVALHYKSRHMSWLHCMWGVGASLGPVIMGQALAGSGWQGGYRIIGILQVVLTVVLLFSLPLWKLPQDAMGGEPFTPQHRSFPELLKITGVPEVLVCFLCYCALESTAGMWASSYCTLVRGLDAQTAASWASLFYLGITAGRFVSGFLTMKMSDRNMIRLGQVLIALGILLVLLPAGNNVLFVGLILIGLGCAPVYPCIIHETPVNFGRELSMSMTGLQMAFAMWAPAWPRRCSACWHRTLPPGCTPGT